MKKKKKPDSLGLIKTNIFMKAKNDIVEDLDPGGEERKRSARNAKKRGIPPDERRCMWVKEGGERCTRWRRRGEGYLCCFAHRRFEASLQPEAEPPPDPEKILKRLDVKDVNMRTKAGVLTVVDILSKDIMCNKSKHYGLSRGKILDLAKISVTLMSDEEKNRAIAGRTKDDEIDIKAREIAESDLDPMIKIMHIGSLVGHDRIGEFVELDVSDSDKVYFAGYEEIQSNIMSVSGTPAQLPSEDEYDVIREEPCEEIQSNIPIDPDEPYGPIGNESEDYDDDPPPLKELTRPRHDPIDESSLSPEKLTEAYRKRVRSNFQPIEKVMEDIEIALKEGMDPISFLNEVDRTSLNAIPVKSIINAAVRHQSNS